MSNNQDRDLVLRRKKEKSLDYNNWFLGEYECSSLTLDREETRDDKEEIGSLKTRSNNVSDQEIYIYRQKNPIVTAGGLDSPRYIWGPLGLSGGHCIDCMMVVKEIEDGLFEEIDKFGWWFEQDIIGESEDDKEKKLVMMSEEV
ncbi:hypothetical protein Tco_0763254 [Tanacetum coccineum]